MFEAKAAKTVPSPELLEDLQRPSRVDFGQGQQDLERRLLHQPYVPELQETVFNLH